MRISIQGDCGAARVLRGYLEESRYFVSDSFPDYSVFLDVDDALETVMVDAVDSDLERRSLRFMQELGVGEFLLKRGTGITSDREIHVSYPTQSQKAVELGLFRALTYNRNGNGWFRRVLKSVAPVLLLTGSLEASELPYYFVHPLPKPILFQPATNFPIVRFWNGTTIVNAGDAANNAVRVNVVAGGAGGGDVTQGTAANLKTEIWGAAKGASPTLSPTVIAVDANINALKVDNSSVLQPVSGTITANQGTGAGAATNYWNTRLTDGTSFIPLPTALGGSGGFKIECLSGCGGAAAFADSAAFTFGTTSIGNTGFVVDDTATNTVAENSAGTPRMNTNRILYTNLRNNAGTEITTWPVTGTFWQATQPVSIAATVATDPTDEDARILGRTKIHDGTDTALVSGTGALNVTCDNCGAPPTFQDEDAFTVGTTSISNIGFLVDDTTPDSAPENSSAIPRMSLNRNIYTQIRDLSAERSLAITAANAAKVDGSAVTQPVSGTVTAEQATASNLKTEMWGGAKGTTTAAVATVTAITGDVNAMGTINFQGTSPWIENVSQFGGSAVATGTGAGGAGIPRVTVSNDSTVGLVAGAATIGSIASITTSVVPGTAATNLGKAEDAVHATADTGVAVLAVRNAGSTVLTDANGDYSPIAVDQYGAIYTAPHPTVWSCFVEAVTVTTQCKAVAGAGLKHYVTSFHASNKAATAQTLDIVFGTGTNCATGITAMTNKFQMGTNALTTSPFLISAPFNTPLVPATAATAICVRPSAATSFGATITGYTAP